MENFKWNGKVIQIFKCFSFNRQWLVLVINFKQSYYLEPIGSVSPKVNTGDGTIFRRESGQSLNLLCPAQAFPTPVFR